MRLIKLYDLTLLVKDGGIFLLISKNWESNQRSGRILEVQSQNVGACRCMHFQVFIFKNYRGYTN